MWPTTRPDGLRMLITMSNLPPPKRWRPDAHTPLYGTQSSRQIEAHAMAGLPPHTLMERAGTAVAHWARALYPHARRVWVACGGGNNGGDGLVAARVLHQWLAPASVDVRIGWLGQPTRLPSDALGAWHAAVAAGTPFAASLPTDADVVVDALLGLGVDRPLTGDWATWSQFMQSAPCPVLAVDLPSGLDADNGHWWSPAPAQPAGPRHTLSLLTLKPGLFTAQGRAACGDLWFDDLGVSPPAPPNGPAPTAWLHAPEQPHRPNIQCHDSHKGTRGQVVVIGGQRPAAGQPGMVGAAVLAARAALRTGAGRVYLGLTDAHPVHALKDSPALGLDPVQPELMFRQPDELTEVCQASSTVTVVGCGGGQSVQPHLRSLMAAAHALVIDADGLNALACDTQAWSALLARTTRNALTVLTPHPLEAARLLGTDTATIQQDRLGQAQALAQRSGALVVLKGSGTVIASPGHTCRINPTGNGLLATAGTGDVLAGMVAAVLATQPPGDDPAAALARVCDAVYRHGQLADEWPRGRHMTASDLLRQ